MIYDKNQDTNISSDILLEESLSETEKALLESDVEGFIKFCLESEEIEERP